MWKISTKEFSRGRVLMTIKYHERTRFVNRFFSLVHESIATGFWQIGFDKPLPYRYTGGQLTPGNA